MKPEDVTEEVCKSGLRGKGGGGAPCGPKWKLMPPVDERPRYLIVNGMNQNRELLKIDKFSNMILIF